MIWQPEFTDKILSRKPGAVHKDMAIDNIRKQAQVVSQVFTGKCRYCNEPIESGIYCDAECAQWHREEQAAKQRKYGMRPAGFD
ncbi:hypothetical protein APE96_004576 [Escherichia coli]|nr:hypothetical protein [Escherichia coli]